MERRGGEREGAVGEVLVMERRGEGGSCGRGLGNGKERRRRRGRELWERSCGGKVYIGS